MNSEDFTKLYIHKRTDGTITPFLNEIGFSLIRSYPKYTEYYKDGRQIFIKIGVLDNEFFYSVNMVKPEKREGSTNYIIVDGEEYKRKITNFVSDGGEFTFNDALEKVMYKPTNKGFTMNEFVEILLANHLSDRLFFKRILNELTNRAMKILFWLSDAHYDRFQAMIDRYHHDQNRTPLPKEEKENIEPFFKYFYISKNVLLLILIISFSSAALLGNFWPYGNFSLSNPSLVLLFFLILFLCEKFSIWLDRKIKEFLMPPKDHYVEKKINFLEKLYDFQYRNKFNLKLNKRNEQNSSLKTIKKHWRNFDSSLSKNILKWIFLPFFPKDKKLERYWWHKLAKVATLIVTISSLSALLLTVSLFYFNLPFKIYDSLYWLSWLPLNFANLFSNLPIYGTLFQYFLLISPLGPLTMPFILVIVFYFLPSLLYRVILIISQNFYMKRVRIILPLAIMVLLLFSIYVSTFQQVINEGSNLADEHCITINPLIIDRKNKYLDQYSLMVTEADSKLFAKSISNYRNSARKYIDEEKLWLAKNKKFLESATFKFIIPAVIKEGANYQHQMYEAEYLTSLYLEQAWDEKDKNIQTELSNKAIDETNKRNEMQDKYNKVWDNGVGKRGWMFNFVKVPTSKCPAENYDIPVIPNPFESLPEEVIGPPLS